MEPEDERFRPRGVHDQVHRLGYVMPKHGPIREQEDRVIHMGVGASISRKRLSLKTYDIRKCQGDGTEVDGP